MFKPRGEQYFWIYIALGCLVVLYSYTWDIYMDWGLFRTRVKGKLFLREKLFYPKWFYYFATIFNFFLRINWVILLPS